MSNVRTKQQPLPAGGMACPYCGHAARRRPRARRTCGGLRRNYVGEARDDRSCARPRRCPVGPERRWRTPAGYRHHRAARGAAFQFHQGAPAIWHWFQGDPEGEAALGIRLLELGAGALRGGRTRPAGTVGRALPRPGNRCPYLAPGAVGKHLAAVAWSFHLRGRAHAPPGAGDGLRSAGRVPVLVSPAADDWRRRAPPGTQHARGSVAKRPIALLPLLPSVATSTYL